MTRPSLPEGGTECPSPPPNKQSDPPLHTHSTTNAPVTNLSKLKIIENKKIAKKSKKKGPTKKKKVKKRNLKSSTKERKTVKSKRSIKAITVKKSNRSPKSKPSSSSSSPSDLKKATSIKTKSNDGGKETAAARKSIRLLQQKNRGAFGVPETLPRYVELVPQEVDFEDEELKIKFMHCLGMDYSSNFRTSSHHLSAVKEEIPPVPPDECNSTSSSPVSGTSSSYCESTEENSEPDPVQPRTVTIVVSEKLELNKNVGYDNLVKDGWERWTDSFKPEPPDDAKPSRMEIYDALQTLLKLTTATVKLNLTSNEIVR